MQMHGNIFIDTNIWLYALLVPSPNDVRHDKAVVLLERIVKPTLSAQVIREVCSNLIKKGHAQESLIQQLLQGWYQECKVTESSLQQSLLASKLRQQYLFSYWDSHIVAAALDSGCQTLLSEDMHDGLIVENILKIQNPFN
jgi:predicted nucleic acid-binding protein